MSRKRPYVIRTISTISMVAMMLFLLSPRALADDRTMVKIERGDTLDGIAREYSQPDATREEIRSTADLLAALNGIGVTTNDDGERRAHIVAGAYLDIGLFSDPVYTVAKGDTLSEILRDVTPFTSRKGRSALADAVALANDLESRDLIRSGQTLTLSVVNEQPMVRVPAHVVTVTSGETLGDIARTLASAAGQPEIASGLVYMLANLNGIEDINLIRSGSVLLTPVILEWSHVDPKWLDAQRAAYAEKQAEAAAETEGEAEAQAEDSVPQKDTPDAESATLLTSFVLVKRDDDTVEIIVDTTEGGDGDPDPDVDVEEAVITIVTEAKNQAEAARNEHEKAQEDAEDALEEAEAAYALAQAADGVWLADLAEDLKAKADAAVAEADAAGTKAKEAQEHADTVAAEAAEAAELAAAAVQQQQERRYQEAQDLQEKADAANQDAETATKQAQDLQAEADKAVADAQAAANAAKEAEAAASKPSTNTIADVALSEQSLGVREDAGSNRDSGGHIAKYRNGIDNDWEWCASFVSWVLNESGVPVLGRWDWMEPGAHRVREIIRDHPDWRYKSARQIRSGAADIRPGDVIFYERGAPGGSGHTGIVTEVLEDGRIVTVEGNWGSELARRGPIDPLSTSGFLGTGEYTGNDLSSGDLKGMAADLADQAAEAKAKADASAAEAEAAAKIAEEKAAAAAEKQQAAEIAAAEATEAQARADEALAAVTEAMDQIVLPVAEETPSEAETPEEETVEAPEETPPAEEQPAETSEEEVEDSGAETDEASSEEPQEETSEPEPEPEPAPEPAPEWTAPTAEQVRSELSAEYRSVLEKMPSLEYAIEHYNARQGDSWGPSISLEDTARLAYLHGFEGEDELIWAVATAVTESGRVINGEIRIHPYVIGDYELHDTGDLSVGIWQIYKKKGWDGSTRDPARNLNPENNAAAAESIHDQQAEDGWSSHKSGRNRDFYDEARAALVRAGILKK